MADRTERRVGQKGDANYYQGLDIALSTERTPEQIQLTTNLLKSVPSFGTADLGPRAPLTRRSHDDQSGHAAGSGQSIALDADGR